MQSQFVVFKIVFFLFSWKIKVGSIFFQNLSWAFKLSDKLDLILECINDEMFLKRVIIINII